VSLAAAPFPFPTAPLLAAPPFLAAVAPFLAAPFLAGPAWVPLRAFRARLDFEAVIRASPPVGSRLPYPVCAGQPEACHAAGTCRQSLPRRSRHRPERWLPAS
jgi:hypothetical protein